MRFPVFFAAGAAVLLGLASAMPAPQDDEDKPMPYNFDFSVTEEESEPDGTFWTHNEKKEESAPDRTEGEYRVWLPDGRLKIVNYYVDGDSGFVPTITYEDNYVPTF